MSVRRTATAALAVAALAALGACSSDSADGAPGDTAGGTATSVAVTTAPAPTLAPDVTTGPLTGAARASCGPVTPDQLEPMAALIRSRLAGVAGVDGVEVGTSAESPGSLLLAAPTVVRDADLAAACALPRVDVRPILAEVTDDPSAAGPDVFPNEFGNRSFRLGPVLADATTFNPDAIAQEIHGTGWLVASRLTADGSAVWRSALAACFGRTEACPTGDLAYLVDDLVVVTGAVAAPLNDAATFSLPGTWSEETAKRLAALIDVAADGSFGPAAG